MVNIKEIDGSSNPRAFFGSEFRRLREAAGLTQAELGKLLYITGSYVGLFETGARWPKRRQDVEHMDVVLASDGHLTRVWEMATRTPYFPDYFQHQAKNEQMATKIEDFSATLVFGLLQTPDYARAVFRAGSPFLTEEEIDRRTATRMGRAKVLRTKDGTCGAQLWVIIHESVLRTPVGGPEVMRGQLLHLTQLIGTHRVVIQVLPFSAGAHALASGSVTLMELRDQPTVAYVEGPCAGQVLSDPAIVRRLRQSFDLVRAAALPPQESAALIDTLAREYRFTAFARAPRFPVPWRASSHSGPEGGNCVEVARDGGTVAVRDSKDPAGPVLTFGAAQWTAFVAFASARRP
ncbi:Scr1 family TA system antitoxin-like transcriptional regulator [Streptomyces sp. SL13]|uniref:Scr1 family TA system antitoxin-like transcriptional regulator n=1 Tax=Streptantibioticus silvisoli TaxID=2705255 RepID=A0AA90K8G1_9ACTN|nr:Scr1 family TA system antitoxin-like transcriptional regulator [Streptantibioticus silvisoli]MDI5964019.1 Scr1 family TA system antitoxin-like transcriptional regulator [Streptantibioticus silvisoli]MDI5970018.1 Scr1 family TA system antitoxin-like transcriptional regulator [Streptantibioticus silvisoli]